MESIDPRLFEPALSQREQLLRDAFVAEYMKDFDPYQACLRVGFQSHFALDWAKRLMAEGYVQRAIAHLTRVSPLDPAAQEIKDRALVENTLREAMQRGPYASRVSAAREYSAMKGWNKGGDDPDSAAQALVEAMKEFANQAPS